MPSSSERTIVVGVVARQPDAVVMQAATLAAQLGARLICATADASRYTLDEHSDGSVRSMTIDPDLAETRDEPIDAALEARLAELLSPTGIRWEMRALAGEPARALAQLAETVDAMLIVVGTHEGGMRGSVRELFNGSVAAHLAHRQHRPVVVIPLAPVGLDAAFPWDPTS
jgi:nucleotide-binding universal stress UspA family protein